MAKIPMYRSVYMNLKKSIQGGAYKPGDFLPTVPELESYYQVSRSTIRKAIALLNSDGLLEIRQGRGTKVLDNSTTQKLNKISSITETLRQNGYKVSTQGMFIEKIHASERVAKALQISTSSEVYRIERVQCADGAPIALMTNYLRATMVPNLEQYINQFTGLYHFLEQHYSIILAEAEERLSAVAASFTDSQILHIPVGTPLLKSCRVTCTEQGPFEYAITKLVADKYEYSVYLRGR